MKKLLKQIIKHKKTCYFISPHLDDAVFSTAGLISYLAKRTRVVVITVFTEAGNERHSLSGLSYLKQCGYEASQVGEFYSDRRSEDKEAIESIGAEVMHLSFIDALWRLNRKPNIVYKFLSYFLNDFRYIYPTFRWHIAKGKINKHDRRNLVDLRKQLMDIVGNEEQSVVFCPLGVGKHVDHVFTREACKDTFKNVVYWEDFPYNLNHDTNIAFIDDNELESLSFTKNQLLRKKAFPIYKTQFGKLFGGREYSLPSEKYYMKGKNE